MKISNGVKNKKLTIAFFGSANSVHTIKWIKYFSGGNNDIYLFSYEKALKNYPLGNIKFYFIEKKFPIDAWPLNSILNLPFALKRIKKIIKEIKPDIIHAHCVTSYGTLASKLGFHPLIITAWGSDILINSQKNLITKLITQHTFKNADLITCDAKHMKRAMINLKADPSKIKIINFGVDTKKFYPGGKSHDLIKKWGFLESDKIVISLRSLDLIYNIETLIKAAPIVLKEVPNAKFIIAGIGAEEKKLKNMANSLNVSKNIRFVGWVGKENLPIFLNAVDLYVSTSLSDAGIASSTAEAMACELPVVVTDSGENKEWIKDGENGFLIPIKDFKKLAEKIIFLLKNSEERQRLGKNARKIIEQKNDYYNEMAKMEKIYRNLI